jgi:fatty acid desaturase
MTTYKWSMDKKYITRRRWAFAIALVLAVLALIGLYELVGHIWWVEGSGYCWGTMEECFPEMFGG